METKGQVFEKLLAEFSGVERCHSEMMGLPTTDIDNWVKVWRERYEKAERFGRSHDVSDLYEESPVEA